MHKVYSLLIFTVLIASFALTLGCRVFLRELRECLIEFFEEANVLSEYSAYLGQL